MSQIKVTTFEKYHSEASRSFPKPLELNLCHPTERQDSSNDHADRWTDQSCGDCSVMISRVAAILWLFQDWAMTLRPVSNRRGVVASINPLSASARSTWILAAALGACATTPLVRAEQFVLFDVTFTYTKQDADTSSPSKSHFYLTGDRINPERPKDWTSPVDYRNGTVHLRAEILEKPAGGEPTTWTMCYIPNRGKGNGYGCTSTDLYREKGVYEKDVSMLKFWENDSIVWAEGIKQIDLVIKDGSGGGGHAHKRADAEKFFPTKVRLTAVQVSAGTTYDPAILKVSVSKQLSGSSEKPRGTPAK